MKRTCLGVMLPLASLLAGATESPPPPASAVPVGGRAVTYIIFEGGGPDQGPGPDMRLNMAALKKTLGSVNSAATRMYGYGLQQIRLLTRSPAFLAEEIGRALDAAEQTGIPVWLHLDPLYAWGADLESRPEDAPPVKFWREPDMREWREFPEGDRLPAYIPRFWFNWGPWCSPSAAVPAIGAPRFVEFAIRQLREGVLTTLTARLQKWKAEGRDHLFAGINVGWEIYLPNYHQGWKAFSNGGRDGPVKAECPRHLRGLEMDEQLVGSRLGYASLYWRGWNEARLRAAALEKGLTRDQMFQQLGYECMHDYMRALAKACFDHGIAPDRIYTHIVALATVRTPDSNMPPIWTAVNPYSTPGFTLDNQGAARFNMRILKRQLAEAPGYRGGGFGAVETYLGLGGRTYVQDAESYKQSLDEMFAHGARVKVIFGSFPLGPASPEAAFRAIRAWLREGVERQ